MANYDDQFLKQGTLAVLGVLRDLHNSEVPVRLVWTDGQLISILLVVNHNELIFDCGALSTDNERALAATNLGVEAELQGGKVSFSLNALTATSLDGEPAFSTPLPERLWFVQRRQYFRISAPGWPMYFGEATVGAQPQLLRFRLCDLSVGGVGALAEGRVPADVTPGSLLRDVTLHLGEWGTFRFDVELVAIKDHQHLNGQLDTVTVQRLSLRFINLTPHMERELQRIIFSLERAARERMNRVR